MLPSGGAKVSSLQKYEFKVKLELNFSGIPLSIYTIWYIYPSFTALTASTLLGRFRSVFTGIFWSFLPEEHSWGRVLMMWHEEVCLAVSTLSPHWDGLSGSGQASMQASQQCSQTIAALLAANEPKLNPGVFSSPVMVTPLHPTLCFLLGDAAT